MEGVFEHIWNNVFEYIFPSFCVQCAREGAILCLECLDAMNIPGVFCCPQCHIATTEGECCGHCAGKTLITRHSAILPMRDDALIHELIHLYKYQYLETLESAFDALIEKFLSEHSFPLVDYIIPTPLHRKRYVERGFNQSERIGRLLSRHTHIPLLNALTRTRNTIKQALLDRESRLVNVRDAFRVIPQFQSVLVGKKVVIVDDVYTTGSTITECARALLCGGVSEVSGWSIARG